LFETRREPMGDGRVRLVVEGELDVASAWRLEAQLSELARRRASVLLDLTAVTFVDSAGARVLWKAATEARAGGWIVELTPPPVEAGRALALTGVLSVMPLAA
jgi:anti-sigma B factor antagonist